MATDTTPGRGGHGADPGHDVRAIRARQSHNNRCLRRSAGRAQAPGPFTAPAPAAPKARALPLRYTPTRFVLRKRMKSVSTAFVD
jgi:hypothetical protein